MKTSRNSEMSMIENYITQPTAFPFQTELPWTVVGGLCETIAHLAETLGDDCSLLKASGMTTPTACGS